MHRQRLGGLVAAVGMLVGVTTVIGADARPVPSPAASRGDREEVAEAYADLPLAFTANGGQTDGRARFVAQGAGFSFFLAPDALVLSLAAAADRPGTPAGVALELGFRGARPDVAVEGTQPLPGTVSYLRGDDPGRWRTGLPSFGEIVYRDLWPGIDLALRGRGGELKYEFRLQPGADVDDIQLAYRGADALRLGTDGTLAVETAVGTLRDSAPVAFQDVAGERRPVASRYALGADAGYGFSVAGYDRSRELVIDPGLAYSTFVGGFGNQTGAAIAVDGAGNAYLTGFTQSPTFPTTPGAFDRSGSAGNDLDAFVTKLNPAGTAAVYSTFLGGSNFEWGRGIAVDGAGNAYVTGQTKSSSFPTTGGAFDRSFNVDTCPRCGIDQYDAFITKLNPTGSALVYSTFLGGTQLDDSLAIALDGSRNAYVAGETASSNFPTTAGGFDRTANGGSDVFVAKLNAAGSALVYATRLGGSDNETPAGIGVGADGSATVGGGTRSTEFPTTPGAFDRTQNGGAVDERFDGFVTKLNPAGSALVYSTFVGGSKSDFVDDVALDGAGNTYLVGGTLSPDYPTTPGTFDRAFSGSESFVTKLNPSGSALVYSTFLGEAGAAAVAPDAAGNVWLAGSTSSPTAFTTPDAFDVQFSGGVSDAYVAQLNPSGSTLLYATFLGGTDNEGSADVAVDAGGNASVTGQSRSPDFPTTAGAFDRTYSGDSFILGGEAFVAKFAVGADAPPPPPPPPPVPAAPQPATPADAATVASPVAFDWSDVQGAVSYTLQVDEISAFGDPLILSTSTTASQLPSTALPEGNWFWRVRAVNSAGTPGPWSAVRSIQVQSTPPPPPPPTPGAPALVSPAPGAVVAQPFTFDWSDVTAAAWYTIQVDDSASFAAPLVWAATSTPSQLATNSLPNGSLFWRVQAFNSAGVGGPMSEVRTVQVQASTPPTTPPPTTPPAGPLPAPALVRPADDARFSPGQAITFDWSDVSGAGGYTIQIDDTESFSSPTVQQATAASQFTTSTLPTTRMWWRVRATDASGAPGTWSGARRVEVKR